MGGRDVVACDVPDTAFWSETMPAHLNEQCPLPFLLALHHRFRLTNRSEQVCSRWPEGDEGCAEAGFAHLR